MAVKGRNKPREPKPGNKSAKYNKTPGMPKEPRAPATEYSGSPIAFKPRMGSGAGSELGLGTSRFGYGTGVGDPQTGLTRGKKTKENLRDKKKTPRVKPKAESYSKAPATSKRPKARPKAADTKNITKIGK